MPYSIVTLPPMTKEGCLCKCNGKYCQQLFPSSISELFEEVLGMLQHQGCVHAKVLKLLSLQTESHLDTPLP